ncbi:DUF3718 domain-containing protein [Ferrimonas marina]|uniref:DUF3718 domain-containing protein n=1 Tax=Ferrimonas marina TaxID=299255 RepID=A0A1M5XX19_9GAMM|nr:DUF3718 domain-containing protein [Ferrimonas marina]SHI04381.1 Protein of unknown function [Ferrimonas marina]
MKTLLLASAVLMTTTVGATEFVAADNSRETKLCMAAATANTLQMNVAIDRSGYKLQSIARGIACNDEPINFFAARYNDDQRVVDRLNRHSRTKAKVNITDLARNENKTIIIGGSAVQ